ncbi:cilia- and flagella-associated protein 69 [Ambystoma mexicanum]|uniref:cilia- and flagella-associated protein 69 n=1 Tax=Ambystoma mexicanum TaxID=8296 RepID=UPI0037E77506
MSAARAAAPPTGQALHTESPRKPIPVMRQVVGDPGSREVAPLKSVDLNRIVKLLEDPLSCTFTERHLRVVKKMLRHYQHGIPLRDLAQLFKILNICAEKIIQQEEFVEPTMEIVKLCGLPFLREKSSDEAKYAHVVSDSISQLGCLMRVPCAQVRIQVCNTVIGFYCPDFATQPIEGLHPTSNWYKVEMAELGGLAESLVLSLPLFENDLEVKIWVLKVLQLLSSSSGRNCNLMIKGHAASHVCSHLNDPDPSGQLLFRSSEILWNLLENGSREELINQLNNMECIHALKEAFGKLLVNGYRHFDHQLRNDLLVIVTLIAENPGIAMIESGFAQQLILFATFPEVKSHNPSVRSLKLSYSNEDFEMKKLLFNLVVILSRDLSSVQMLSDGKVILALFYYVRVNEKQEVHDWSVAHFEDLQLHAIATLGTVAPLLVEDYMTCQGNTRILLFLEWCVGQDQFFGQGNCFHGTGGRGNKRAQMRYCLRLMRSMVSLGNETVNQDLCDQGAISQLLGILNQTANCSKEKEDATVLEIQADILFILSTLCENDLHKKDLFGTDGVDLLILLLKMDPNKFYSGIGHNRLILGTLDTVWCCVIGCYTAEDYFLEKEGLFVLLDLLSLNQSNMNNVILGILVEFCDNPKTISHLNTWRGSKNQTSANLLIQLWRQEEDILGVHHDENRIIDAKNPLIGVLQEEQGIMPMPANYPSSAIMDVAENMRAKIYSVFCKLGFEDLPGLEAKDYVTLAVISKYLDFKVGEIWREIRVELKEEGFRPVTPDEEAVQAIGKAFENSGKMVAEHQTQIIENKRQQDLQEEQQVYAEIQANHKQNELTIKSWEDFLARTSNYEVLKRAKRLQEKSIESSRPKARQRNGGMLSTRIAGLHTTIPCGPVVTVKSTPSSITGGPLADTSLALKRIPIRGGAPQNVKGVKMSHHSKTDQVSVN